MKEKLERYLKTWLSEELDIPKSQISTNSKLIEDLGIDSLDFVELMIMVEDFIGEEINEDIAEKFETIGDVLEYVEKEL